MIEAIQEARHSNLVGLRAAKGLIQAVVVSGLGPMTLLEQRAVVGGHQIAISDDQEDVTFAQLRDQCNRIAAELYETLEVPYRAKVALMCRDHVDAVRALFSFARLGSHITLMNPQMSSAHAAALLNTKEFDFVVYDDDVADKLAGLVTSGNPSHAHHATTASIAGLATTSSATSQKLHRAGPATRVGPGSMIVMTGGTTGVPKSAARPSSALAFAPPFAALLSQAHLARYSTVFIPTPICHGFGLSSLFGGVALGSTVYLTERFDAKRGCQRVHTNQIEVMCVVPLMLQRMLDHDAQALRSLRCIIVGGGMLTPGLAAQTLSELGPVLYNTYGTSEAGFCVMAPPSSLAEKPTSIGRPIPGVKIKLADTNGEPVPEGTTGELCIRSSWSVSPKGWVPTGDLAKRDRQGHLFLRGRVDDMIVSGAENVYPTDVENIVAQHRDVKAVAVVGIPDPEFGQRLKAVVVLKEGVKTTHDELLSWIRPRVARFQMPAKIEFRDDLPVTSLNKIDRKALRAVSE